MVELRLFMLFYIHFIGSIFLYPYDTRYELAKGCWPLWRKLNSFKSLENPEDLIPKECCLKSSKSPTEISGGCFTPVSIKFSTFSHSYLVILRCFFSCLWGRDGWIVSDRVCGSVRDWDL